MVIIDKESLIEHMRKAYKGNIENGFKWDLISAVVVIEAEDEITPDAEPIVRCRDCKYWYNDEYKTEGYCDLTKYFHMTADDFCSRGEPK